MTDRDTGSMDWRRAARGLLWLGFGVFLLLTTTGVLPGSFWLRAAAFWPVLLIGAGLRLMFQSSRAPILVLLSPLVILSTLAFVAATDVTASGETSPVRAARPEGVTRWSLEGGLAFAGAEVGVGALPEHSLLEGEFTGGTARELRVRTAGDVARIRFPGRSVRVFVPLGWRLKERWDLRLADDLPIRLDLDLAFTDTDLNLAGARIERADFDGAFNRTTLRLGAPEEEVRLVWEGAFNSVTIVVPDDTPVRVSTDGFLSVVRGRSGHAREGPGYRVVMDGAFNRLRVRSDG